MPGMLVTPGNLALASPFVITQVYSSPVSTPGLQFQTYGLGVSSTQLSGSSDFWVNLYGFPLQGLEAKLAELIDTSFRVDLGGSRLWGTACLTSTLPVWRGLKIDPR